MNRLSSIVRIVPWMVALGVLATTAIHAPKLMVLNESSSLPRGLYVRAVHQAADRGAVVAVTQPVVARPYLAGLHMPADVPLLKRVAAAAGDPACASIGVVRLPDRVLPVREHDRLGNALPVWGGCRRLGADEIFLAGDTANSFDSRNFGPVSRTQVEGVFREFVTW